MASKGEFRGYLEKKCILFEKIWPEACGALLSLLQSPFLDFALMTGEEHVGHTPAFVFCRAGIDGRSQEVILERVGEGALLVTDDTGDNSNDSVGDDCRRQLTTGQHIVAYGDLFGDQMLADAIVYAFVMAAEDDQVVEE